MDSVILTPHKKMLSDEIERINVERIVSHELDQLELGDDLKSDHMCVVLCVAVLVQAHAIAHLECVINIRGSRVTYKIS